MFFLRSSILRRPWYLHGLLFEAVGQERLLLKPPSAPSMVVNLCVARPDDARVRLC